MQFLQKLLAGSAELDRMERELQVATSMLLGLLKPKLVRELDAKHDDKRRHQGNGRQVSMFTTINETWEIRINRDAAWTILGIRRQNDLGDPPKVELKISYAAKPEGGMELFYPGGGARGTVAAYKAFEDFYNKLQKKFPGLSFRIKDIEALAPKVPIEE